MNGSIETNYLDGFQYDNRHAYDTSASLYTVPVLKFVPTSEGYYDFTENKYIYNYTDHLGNIRVSYKNNGTALEVIDTNSYYPFGLKHQNGPVVPAPFAGVPYNYKYNGKELQETGMYDYGARFYMPDMGRWGVVDPLAEKDRRWTPYRYAYNNPIRFIDPDGRLEDWVGTTDENGSTTWHWDDKIKSASQAAAAGYDSYSDGKTNNTYTSISGSEVTLKENGNWSEDFTAVNETTLGAAQAKMFGKYASGISVNFSWGHATKSYSLAYNWGTEQFRIFETDGIKYDIDFDPKPKGLGDVGFSVFQMTAYGEKDGVKYTDVFEGAKEYSTEFSGSVKYGGAHSFSSSEKSPMRAPYGTQTTSFNLGTGYNVGVSRTYTTDITKQVNNAPSAITNWLQKNIKYSPQFN
ncbi:MAG: RHS repeat-associated core domain-containing protein [Chryseobacterium sp.]|nr:RHS repeat-associated core domain-containing protein [Chryseobacterium sp.]